MNGAFLVRSPTDTSSANPFDLDFIPTSAIDRIEMLEDSDASQNGTNAIAGVDIWLAEQEGVTGDVT